MAGGHSVWRHTWACVVQTGRLGQVCGRKAIHQFVYKNLDLVKVSNLQMVDDLIDIDIQECGFKSEASNMFIKNQIEMKLLPLHKDKFKKIHIGQEFELCPILKVHDDDSDIKLVTEDKFLGDIGDIPPQTDVLCMTTSSLYGLFSHM